MKNIYERLAERFREFSSIEFLANSVENITEEQGVKSLEDLEEFLNNELDYSVN